MNTERTDITDKQGGRLAYDAECRICSGLATVVRQPLAARGIRLVPLHTDGKGEGVVLVTGAGQRDAGVDAILSAAERFRWMQPLVRFARRASVHPILDKAYRGLARHRHIVPGWCGAGALILLPTAVCSGRGVLPAWAFMWAMAAAIFFVCKALTWTRTPASPRGDDQPSRRLWSARAVGYFAAWPGMDAARFFKSRGAVGKPPAAEWLAASVKTALGAWLLWGAARLAPNTLAAGWIGMLGLIFLLHFGVFHMLSVAWRARGVNAAPLMRNPAGATSLSDFWSRRWNSAFNDLARELIFRPALRRCGVAGATMLAFFVSGLVHELVISLPAGGGYGLPTIYFVWQGIGICFERSEAGRQLRLGRGFRGWLFVMLITAAPAFWLFHPPFVERVIVPFLRVIGAL